MTEIEPVETTLPVDERPSENSQLLFDQSEWDFDTMRRTYDAIEEVALKDLGLDVYPNQIEIVSSEQMIDAYSSIGMPLMYQHWSFGKSFARNSKLYEKGFMSLAYELVINSNPCISYNMEDNTMTMQTLVMAHAAFGHNHFFKNNYLFTTWTEAQGILDYLQFAKKYIVMCEEKHGTLAVEEILDAAHALMDQGVFKFLRKKQTLAQEKDRQRAREEYAESTYNDLWRTLPNAPKTTLDPMRSDDQAAKIKRRLKLPEENILYFLEKNSPILEPWKREILRIVRKVSQYFYPQRQTKVMNEGCATFVHHYIMNALYEKGCLSEGSMLEFNHMHSNVLSQPAFDHEGFSGINPYALGFAMMQDIVRVCTDPSDEDREWFKDQPWVGCGDWRMVLRDAWANYRDESFILQYLTPHLIRSFKLFELSDKEEDKHYTVEAIHDKRGYKAIRKRLALSYDIGHLSPDVQVVDVDLLEDRTLRLQHIVRDGVPLKESSAIAVLRHVITLWGYDVELHAVDVSTEEPIYTLKQRVKKKKVDRDEKA